MDSLKLSAASLQWLATGGHVAVGPASPLGALVSGSKSSPEERRASVERELTANGISFDAASPSPEADDFKEALGILGQPEALVRIRAMVPEQPVVTFGTMVRGGRACRFTVDGDTIGVTPAWDIGAMAEALAKELTYEGPLAKQEVLFWPSAIKLLSFLWQGSQDPEKPLPRAEALRQMASAGTDEQLQKTLDELIRTGFLEVKGDELMIPERHRPWLRLAWSGHAFQVEYVSLEGGSSLEQALESTGDLLIFLGPPGQRILNLPIIGDGVAQRTDGGKPVEQKLLRLCTPPADAMRQVLRILLRIEAAAAA